MKLTYFLYAVLLLAVGIACCKNKYDSYTVFYENEGVIVLAKDSASFKRAKSDIVKLPYGAALVFRKQVAAAQKEKKVMGRTAYITIREYAKNLQDKLRDVNGFYQIDSLRNFPVYIKMEKNELINPILDAEGEHVLAVFGLEQLQNGTNDWDFTASFLALDGNDEVDARHLSGDLDGQQTWLPKNKTYIRQKNQPDWEANNALPLPDGTNRIPR